MLFRLIRSILFCENCTALGPFSDPVVPDNIHEALHAFEKLLGKKGCLILIVWGMFLQKLQHDNPHIRLGMCLALEHKSPASILELKLIGLGWLDVYHLMNSEDSMGFDIYSLELLQINRQISVLVFDKSSIFSLALLVHSQIVLDALAPWRLRLVIYEIVTICYDL